MHQRQLLARGSILALALAHSASHKATANVLPGLWQPSNGGLVTMILVRHNLKMFLSDVLKALVPSGANDQICVWSMNEWTKQAYKSLHISSGRAPYSLVQNHAQFDQDQIHLLVIRESLIAGKYLIR
ncbi:hypothetical protein POM88_044980 [Heracleum sosnowskyi]|uniref:Uncharacterized protein n=1 Tax=Heracleum sosnowskyi TaxID=360622 RepID=A0AAD8H674_9APIA|nr:hypothetical protein POM88_044980 [Heracleum sosnowskyi]